MSPHTIWRKFTPMLTRDKKYVGDDFKYFLGIPNSLT